MSYFGFEALVFFFELTDYGSAPVVDEGGGETFFEVGDSFAVVVSDSVDGGEGDGVVSLDVCRGYTFCELCDDFFFCFFV